MVDVINLLCSWVWFCVPRCQGLARSKREISVEAVRLEDEECQINTATATLGGP